MSAGRGFRLLAGVLGFAFGTAAIASAQTAEVEAELRLRLAQLKAQQAQLAGQPKQPPAAKPLPPAVSAMPPGAVARLGDDRLRHAGQPQCVTFSPDGTRVFSGGEDGKLRVWDAATGAALTTLAFPGDSTSSTPTFVRFTPDGKRLMIQNRAGQVSLLHPDTLLRDSVLGTAGGEVAVSPDGRLLAAVSPTGLLTVTELADGLAKLELPRGNPFAFRPDGRTIAVADKVGKVALHMLAGGKPVMTFDNAGPLNGLAFSPDGDRVACGAGDVAKVWDLSDRKNPRVVAEVKAAGHVRAWVGKDRIAAGDGFNSGVYDLAAKTWVGRVKGITGEWAVSPDGTKAASTTLGGLRVRLWDLTAGKQLHADNDTFPDAALLAPAADGKTVFVVAGDAAFLWPVAKSAATPAGTFPGKVVAAAAGTGRLAVVTADGVLVYDGFDPAKPLPAKPARTLTEHAAGTKTVVVSPDGKKLAYSGTEMKTVIADAATGKTLRVLPVQTAGIALAFDPEGETLAVIGRDGFLRLWAAGPVGDDQDTDLWKVRIQRGKWGAVAFSPNGKLIAASSSGTLKVASASDGSELFSVGGLFDNGLFQQATFSADSRLLITASEGATGGVIAWELATRSPVRRFSTGFGTVYRLGVFPDGTRVVSAGAEEVITLWDLTGRHAKDAPKADELLAAWADLDSLDASKGYPALRTLAAGGARGVRVIAAGIDETIDTRKKIAAWVKDLGSEEFVDREAATKALLAQGLRAIPALQAAAGSDVPEARVRATDVLNTLVAKNLVLPADRLAGDELRLFRTVQVLEDLGGAEVKPLLDRIAAIGGESGDAAKATLKRKEK